jgi:hypothetical protein
VPLNPPPEGGEGLHSKRMANSPAALLLQALPPATRQKFVSGRARTRIFGYLEGIIILPKPLEQKEFK